MRGMLITPLALLNPGFVPAAHYIPLSGSAQPSGQIGAGMAAATETATCGGSGAYLC
jgi:hypothetical protein